MFRRFAAALFPLLLATTVLAQQSIQIKGSDTLVNVAQAWAAAYSGMRGGLSIAVNGGGSGNGIAAMLDGNVDIANASRAMRQGELELARQRGLHPLRHVAGYDAVAVYLHPDNPNRRLTMDQLREIYIRDGGLRRWSQFGDPVPGCPSDEVVVVSRQNNSGTYAYFRGEVLGRGKYRQGALEMHGSRNVVDLVSKTPCAIGYSGLAYANDQVRMACIAAPGEVCVTPDIASASTGGYPLSRPLLMYTNGEPRGEIKAYIDWIRGDAGQCILYEMGYAPIREVHCHDDKARPNHG